MRLTNFSITNYRSITTAHKISLENTTILVGKNNEGKSNILRGLNVTMTILSELSENVSFRRSRTYMGRRSYMKDESRYIWQRDFPINFQTRKSGLQTTFILEFNLDDADRIKFKEYTGSNINESLALEIKIGRDSQPTCKVKDKRGRGSTSLNTKIDKVAKFVTDNVEFNYIPTIRTDSSIMDIVDSMLSSSLRNLEKDDEYQKAINKIIEIQKPILAELSKKIKVPLQEFLPNINSVSITIPEGQLRRAVRNDFDIVIDDGTPTDLALKGDGVKSLAALSLLKNRLNGDCHSIIAIEEPESHLHPHAIHQLNDVIQSLGENHQVVLTTHNPLFVDRDNLKSNVLVDNGRATPCKNIKQIRDILGIRASDNLINANNVLVVEGKEDEKALKALLGYLSPKISKAFKEKHLVIDSLDGATNLSYKLSLLRNALCNFHCFLDGDKEGLKAIQKAKDANLLESYASNVTACNGMTETEFEDLIDVNLYKKEFLEKYNVDVTKNKPKGNPKWSEKLKSISYNQGQAWNDKLESSMKSTIAELVEKNPSKALNPHHQNIILSLIDTIERRFKL